MPSLLRRNRGIVSCWLSLLAYKTMLFFMNYSLNHCQENSWYTHTYDCPMDYDTFKQLAHPRCVMPLCGNFRTIDWLMMICVSRQTMLKWQSHRQSSCHPAMESQVSICRNCRKTHSHLQLTSPSQVCRRVATDALSYATLC